RPPRAWGELPGHARPCRLAQRDLDLPRDLSAVAREPAHVLDVRGHTDPDRPRLHVPVPPRHRLETGPDPDVHRHPRRVLAGVRSVSAARTGLRLHAGGCTGELAAPL